MMILKHNPHQKSKNSYVSHAWIWSSEMILEEYFNDFFDIKIIKT